METKYHNNPVEFSKSIILSHLYSILKYAQRFYKRQFIDRKPLSGVTVTKFNECLNVYFEKGEVGEKGLPNVNDMASQLHLSLKYLSDLLKQETGKTALELIYLYVISEAIKCSLSVIKTYLKLRTSLVLKIHRNFPGCSKKK
jgi:AraC-like DNA-binding protein